MSETADDGARKAAKPQSTDTTEHRTPRPFTPGPWKQEEVPTFGNTQVGIMADVHGEGRLVGTARTNAVLVEEIQGNCALMEALPKLFGFCWAVTRAFRRVDFATLGPLDGLAELVGLLEHQAAFLDELNVGLPYEVWVHTADEQPTKIGEVWGFDAARKLATGCMKNGMLVDIVNRAHPCEKFLTFLHWAPLDDEGPHHEETKGAKNGADTDNDG